MGHLNTAVAKGEVGDGGRKGGRKRGRERKKEVFVNKCEKCWIKVS